MPDKETIFYVQKECVAIIADIENQRWEIDDFRIEMLLAAEGTLVLAELYVKYLNIDIVRVSDTKKWLNKFCEQWKNKDYELCEIVKMFEIMEA